MPTLSCASAGARTQYIFNPIQIRQMENVCKKTREPAAAAAAARSPSTRLTVDITSGKWICGPTLPGPGKEGGGGGVWLSPATGKMKGVTCLCLCECTQKSEIAIADNDAVLSN